MSDEYQDYDRAADDSFEFPAAQGSFDGRFSSDEEPEEVQERSASPPRLRRQHAVVIDSDDDGEAVPVARGRGVASTGQRARVPGQHRAAAPKPKGTGRASGSKAKQWYVPTPRPWIPTRTYPTRESWEASNASNQVIRDRVPSGRKHQFTELRCACCGECH